MLKGIDPLLDGELLKVLAEMGHGDELAIVDANFPAASMARQLVRLTGSDVVAATRAILSVLPLDTVEESPLCRMQVVGVPDEVAAVHEEVHHVCEVLEQRSIAMSSLERLAFYDRARTAYAVVLTGELRPYGCFLLTKGVLTIGAERSSLSAASRAILEPIVRRSADGS